MNSSDAGFLFLRSVLRLKLVAMSISLPLFCSASTGNNLFLSLSILLILQVGSMLQNKSKSAYAAKTPPPCYSFSHTKTISPPWPKSPPYIIETNQPDLCTVMAMIDLSEAPLITDRMAATSLSPCSWCAFTCIFSSNHQTVL